MAIASSRPLIAPCDGCDKEGYLVSDGKPMAETDAHRRCMFYAISALENYFAGRREAYVSGNNFIHYLEGNRKKYVSPDCYIVFDVPQQLRDNYKVWENDGQTPDVVFEFTSKETRTEDEVMKLPLYEKTLGVSEYFRFDPTGDYLTPRLQGFRLAGGKYERIEADTEGRLVSEELGLILEARGEEIRFFDPAAGEYLRSPFESEADRLAEKQRAEAEKQRADAERQRADTAEAELERLRAELAALQQ